MTGHTKEPWVLRVGERDDPEVCDLHICGDIFVIANLSGPQYAHQHPNARRIVDCVNALATIPDPEAYMNAARGMREALGRIATVDMGGGFLGALACRQVASEAILAFDAAQGGQ